MNRERSGQFTPITVEVSRVSRVFFSNPKLAHTASLGFNAARFIPAEIKAMLDQRDCWADVVQSLYCAIIDFYRNLAPKGFDPEGNKVHYKTFVRHVWHELYVVLRNYIPEYKRKYHDKFMSPESLNNVHEFDGSGKPFVRERDLVSPVLSEV